MFHILGAVAVGWTISEVAAAVTAIAGSITAVATAGKTLLELQETIEKRTEHRKENLEE